MNSPPNDNPSYLQQQANLRDAYQRTLASRSPPTLIGWVNLLLLVAIAILVISAFQ